MSQTEIDALLTGLAGKQVPPAPASKKSEPLGLSSRKSGGEPKLVGAQRGLLEQPQQNKISYRLYDFRRPDKLSKEHHRLLRGHFSLFWRRVANYLANLARCSVEVSLLEVDQSPYKDIFVSHRLPMLMCTFQLANEYQGMMKINLSQIFCLVDRLMGGGGVGATKARSVTDFERSLCTDIFGKLLSLYANIRRVDNFQVDNMETDERLLPRTLPADELMVRAIYDVRIGNHSGYLNLYLPMRSVTSILAGDSGAMQSRRSASEDIPQSVSKLRLPLKVILGEANLAAKEVAGLKVGTVISLEQNSDKPLKVEVGSVPRFLAKPGLLGNQMAISIDSRWEGE
ncbi:unnamed protein product [Phaeothamnion confervicola]